MDRRIVLAGETHAFVVLSLCSHADRGDYQVLPRGSLSLELVPLRESLLGRGFRAAMDDSRLLADMDGCSVVLYECGRAVLESVRPDSGDAAWALFSSMVAPDAGSRPGAT